MGDPSRKPLPERNAQRGEQAEVVAIDVLRDQFLASPHVDGDGIIRNQRSEFHREYGKSFTQTERSAQVLAKLEKRLSLLPGGGDRGEEGGFVARAILDRNVLK